MDRPAIYHALMERSQRLEQLVRESAPLFRTPDNEAEKCVNETLKLVLGEALWMRELARTIVH